MASTTFTDGSSVIYASWLNDINTVAYNTVPDIISGTQVVGAATSATNATNLTGSGSISSTTTATTQSAGNNSTKVATTAYVDAAVSTVGGSYVTLSGSQTITGAKTFSVAPIFSVIPTISYTPSMIRMNTANGYGSTNTKIRRLTNSVVSQGTDITYTDSATLGAKFVINTSGIYAISYSDNFNNADIVALSINTADGTSGILARPVGEVLIADATAGANYTSSVSWIGYLVSGTEIRPHTNGALPVGSGTNQVQFTISRVA